MYTTLILWYENLDVFFLQSTWLPVDVSGVGGGGLMVVFGAVAVDVGQLGMVGDVGGSFSRVLGCS
jgi:hypothetical protein